MAKKILVVDDNPDNLESMKLLLSSYPDELEVVKAESGDKALELIEEDNFSVALIDIMMPDLNGYEVCKIIRSNKKLSYVPIILITAKAMSTQDRLNGYDAGCEDYVLKPVDRHELFARLRSMLRTKKLHDDLLTERNSLDKIVNERTEKLRLEIRDHRRTTKALKLSEQKFSGISRAAQDGIIMIDNNGNTSFWNKSAERIFGYTEDEVMGRDIHKFIAPERYYEDFKKGFEIFMKDGSGSHADNTIEIEAKHRDGHEFFVELSVSSMSLYGEWHAVAIVRDITNRKIAQESLYQSEKELLLRNQIADIFLKLDDEKTNDGVIQFILKIFSSSFGCLNYIYDKEDLKCLSMISSINGEKSELSDSNIHLSGSVCDSLFKQFLHGRETYYTNETMVIAESGEEISNALLAPITHQGKVIGMIIVGNKSSESGYDEDDKKLLRTLVDYMAPILDSREERREEIKNRLLLSAAIEQTTEAILITDLNGNIQYINPAFERVTGYTQDEVIGKNPKILKSGKQNSEFYKNMWDKISKGEIWKSKVTNKKKSGELYEEEMTISPVRNDIGVITNYVAVKYDITKEVMLAKQLRQAQKMEAMGTLASGIAHDFNNVLQGIFMSVYLAKGSLADDSEAKKFLEQTEVFSSRGSNLIKQILTFSRKSDHEFAIIHIVPILKEVIKLMRSTLPATIEINHKIPELCGNISGSLTQVHQVMVNLCTNAGFAMRDTGGILNICLEEIMRNTETALILDVNIESYLKLTVSDTGIGMSPDIQEHIFEPFYTTKSEGEGTGLGLSVVHGIIESHKGAITVNSKPGEGTVFYIYFPVIKNSVDAIMETPDIDLRGNEIILLVDDEISIIEMEKRILEDFGYIVTTAYSGKEALALFRNSHYKFDLILTDQSMPEMTGAQLAWEVLKINSDFPIIIMTGNSQSIDKNTAQQLGVKDLLLKPFNVNETGEKIRSVLDSIMTDPEEDIVN